MPLLEVSALHARYHYAPVLQGVPHRRRRRDRQHFGRNGAGKTTTLWTIMGWLRPSEGTMPWRSIGGLSPDRIFRRGIAFIPEDRRIFATLSVEENLMLGLFSRWGMSASDRRRHFDRVVHLFPRLRERRRQLGKTLSGGEQQMLAIGRALIGEPKLLLVDEPSEGLAPMVVNEIFEALGRMRDDGIALLVEQNVGAWRSAAPAT